MSLEHLTDREALDQVLSDVRAEGLPEEAIAEVFEQAEAEPDDHLAPIVTAGRLLVRARMHRQSRTGR